MTKTIKNETRKEKRRFLRMFLGTLGASLLGVLLRKILSEQGTVRAEEGFVITGEGIKKQA